MSNLKVIKPVEAEELERCAALEKRVMEVLTGPEPVRDAFYNIFDDVPKFCGAILECDHVAHTAWKTVCEQILTMVPEEHQGTVKDLLGNDLEDVLNLRAEAGSLQYLAALRVMQDPRYIKDLQAIS